MSSSTVQAQATSSTTTLPTGTNSKRRPPTHKPRGICKYYSTPRGCFAGDKCKFLHGEPTSGENNAEESVGSTSQNPTPVLLTPYDQSKRCHFYAKGYCKRGEDCWFRHVRDARGSPSLVASNGKERDGSESDSDSVDCSICLEKPVTYGLLGGCGHVFCISCIKQWRDPGSKSIDVVITGNNKKCPMCRTSSNFITPSSKFFKHESAEKGIAVAKYKESMAKVHCRYFQKTKEDSTPMCPFGKDCFYKHENADGTPYVFAEGASVWLRRYAARRRPGLNANGVFMLSDASDPDDIGFGFPFPIDIGSLPFIELFNPAPSTDAGGNVNPRTDGAQRPSNGNVEVSMGQIDVNTWNVMMNHPFRRGRQTETTVAEGDNNTPAAETNDVDEINAVRRNLYHMQEIGRSLEEFTDAMAAGATLDRIGRIGQTLRGQLRPRDEEANHPSEAEERLQNLADQMLASIDVLRAANATRLNPTNPRSGATPTPLESASTSSTRRRANRLRREVNADYDSEEDDDGMPGLQSISNSSEDDYDESDDDDFSDDGYNAAEQALRRIIGQRTRPTSTYNEGFAAPVLPRENTGEADDPADALTATLETPVAVESTVDELGEVPPPAQGSSDPPTPNAPALEPPFVTDGRGRVVWTSSEDNSPITSAASTPTPPSSTVSPSPTAYTSSSGSPSVPSSRPRSKTISVDTAVSGDASGADFTTDGRGRVIAAGVGSSSSSATSSRADGLPGAPPSTGSSDEPTSPSERSFLGRVFGALF